jgi:thiamine biosynthesis lipoprotein
LFQRIEREIARQESLFSLFRDSALTRLNRDGRLGHPPPEFHALLALAGRVHAATGGAFDPTVQPLWQAVAQGAPLAPARALVGWDRVTVTEDEIRLGRGQALTLNGIAQGWAADRIAGLLRAEGFRHALIDMGEIAALGLHPEGRPWRAAVTGPSGAVLAECELTGRALATSSPRGTLIGGGAPHILSPQGGALRWETAAVAAPSAALADGLSTAFCLMDRAGIDVALRTLTEARLVLLA